MLKGSYDPERNLVTIDFEGEIDFAEAERFYPEIQKMIPKDGKGFKLLTDFTFLQRMDAEVETFIKKTMDLFNQQGVTEIVRVIPDPQQDPGFNILSIFHYSKQVEFMILTSREEAEERLKKPQS